MTYYKVEAIVNALDVDKKLDGSATPSSVIFNLFENMGIRAYEVSLKKAVVVKIPSHYDLKTYGQAYKSERKGWRKGDFYE